MKKKPIRKIRLGKWNANSVNGIIWHVYYNKTHYARISVKEYRHVTFKKFVPLHKLYYLTRFVNIVVNETK